MSVAHVGAAEQLIEHDEQLALARKLAGDLLDPQHLGVEMADPSVEVIRKVDGRVQAIGHRELHSFRRYWKPEMRDIKGDGNGFHEGGYARHVRARQEDEI